MKKCCKCKKMVMDQYAWSVSFGKWMCDKCYEEEFTDPTEDPEYTEEEDEIPSDY